MVFSPCLCACVCVHQSLSLLVNQLFYWSSQPVGWCCFAVCCGVYTHNGPHDLSAICVMPASCEEWWTDGHGVVMNASILHVLSSVLTVAGGTTKLRTVTVFVELSGLQQWESKVTQSTSSTSSISAKCAKTKIKVGSKCAMKRTATSKQREWQKGNTARKGHLLLLLLLKLLLLLLLLYCYSYDNCCLATPTATTSNYTLKPSILRLPLHSTTASATASTAVAETTAA